MFVVCFYTFQFSAKVLNLSPIFLSILIIVIFKLILSNYKCLDHLEGLFCLFLCCLLFLLVSVICSSLLLSLEMNFRNECQNLYMKTVDAPDDLVP